jgi:polysaccharide pyruvyl transferase WcaK-like protein
MRVLISGPYGGHNLGDEFILSCVASHLLAAGCDVVATSSDPDYTLRCHGLQAITGLDAKRGQLSLLRNVRAFDAVIFGGGEQIAEGRLRSPLWGHLPHVAFTTLAANRARIPTMHWSVGVGAIQTAHGRWMLQHWVKKSSVVAVRDQQSLCRLKEAGFEAGQLCLSADPVFDLPRVEQDSGPDIIVDLVGDPDADRPVILVVPANDGFVDLNYLAPLMRGCRQAALSHRARVVVFFMDRQARYDAALIDHPEMKPDAETVFHGRQMDFSRNRLAALFASVDVVVAARMHPLILAITQGTPWLNIARGPKMIALGEMFEQSPLRVDSLSAEEVATTVAGRLSIPRGTWQAGVDPYLRLARERASFAPRLFFERVVPLVQQG